MLEFSRFKIALVLAVCLFGLIFSVPSLAPQRFAELVGKAQEIGILPSKKLNLGLDLQGGAHLLLEVDIDSYIADQAEFATDEVRSRLREKNIGYTGLRMLRDGKYGVTFNLRDKAQEEELHSALSPMLREMSMEIDDMLVQMEYRSGKIKDMHASVLAQSIEIIRRRVDETGTKEPIIQRQGDSRILLQVPGMSDPARLKKLLGKTAKLSFHLVNPDQETVGTRIVPPSGYRLYEDAEQEGLYFIVEKRANMNGDMLVNASPGFDQYGAPVVNITLNTQGARKFARITREGLGKRFAIVLDKKVIVAPVMQAVITDGRSMIQGGFTTQETQDLALLLRAGALPAPLEVVEERSVGPSLGQDSIEAGKKASVVGLVLVMGMMIVLYKRFGVYANLALMVNLLLIVAVLSLFEATLTLPGIAGIVLTMGIAVDANVLIFERIKEELRLGKTPFAAVEQGFLRAFQTIWDANLTTLIITALLFAYGSGAIKGFAVTLSVGVLASMFSAILLSRMMIVLWLKRTKPKEINI